MRRTRLALALLVLLAAVLGRGPRPGGAQGTPAAEGGGLVTGPGLALLPGADDGSAVVAAGLVGDHALVLARNGLAEPATLRVMAAGLDGAGELAWVADTSYSTSWSNEEIDEGVQPGFVPAGGVAMAVLPLPDGDAGRGDGQVPRHRRGRGPVLRRPRGGPGGHVGSARRRPDRG